MACCANCTSYLKEMSKIHIPPVLFKEMSCKAVNIMQLVEIKIVQINVYLGALTKLAHLQASLKEKKLENIARF